MTHTETRVAMHNLAPELQEAFTSAPVRRAQLAEIRELSELVICDVARAKDKSEEVRAKWKEASGEMALDLLNAHIERLFRAVACLLHGWHITEASTVLATAEALLKMSEDKPLVNFYTAKIAEYQSQMVAFARDSNALHPLEIEGLRNLARKHLSPFYQHHLDNQLKNVPKKDWRA